MATTVKLSDGLINDARRYGDVYSRSIPRQIEYWARIGRIAEENPDLPYSLIKDILLAKQEASDKQITPYEFG
jgi:hypothetical protein